MDIACEQCNGKFKIPDDKIPKGKAFSVTCPKCKSKIAIDTQESVPAPAEKTPPPPPEPEASPEKALFDEVSTESYDAGEKPFDFVEEGVETAMLCEPDPDIRSSILSALEHMGYQTREPESAVDALKQMRFHVFDLVVLNENFDTDNPDNCDVLTYLDRLSMDTRRNVFVCLLTDRFRTTDNMAAFNKSVNLVINLKNIGEIEKVLKRGVTDNASFYRVYKESLVSTGRI
ncbi:MAG: zinc-ribbon domain-containing protein [Desulfobacterales bacterium]